MLPAASANPDSTDARLVATTHTSSSTSRLRHSDSATHTASWVLPHDSSQPPGGGPATRTGTSATTAPATSAAPRLAAVSARALNASASGGTGPDRIGRSTRTPRDPVGPPLSAGCWPRSEAIIPYHAPH